MIGQSSIFNAVDARRRTRQPQHTFNVKHAPYEIQPFMIAPVLAGETLQSASFQTRALTNPIKAPLIGWWLEHYVFYVKLSDIDAYNGALVSDANSLLGMLVNDSSVTGHADFRTAALADRFYYWNPTGVNTMTGMDYVRACLKAVTAAYFRDQDAAWDQYTIDGNPATYLQNTTAWESAILESAMDTAIDVDIQTTETEGTPNIVTVSTRDVVTALQQYELLYEQGLINMTYEDYLRQEGISAPQEAEHKPELIRYMRDWQYPSSHVIPDTAVAGDSDVTSAVSWVVRGRIDKRRFFREPGFIFGVTCARPKVYLNRQYAPLVSLMIESADWLPRVTAGSREAGWKKITDAATDLLLGQASGDWWIDLRDLFVFGDQFVAGDAHDIGTATDLNSLALPSTSLDTRGPVQAGVDGLFVSGDATGGVRQDGVMRLAISSRVRNLTPRGADVRLLGR